MPAEASIGLDGETKNRLDQTRDGLGFGSHAETVRWLLNEVGR